MSLLLAATLALMSQGPALDLRTYAANVSNWSPMEARAATIELFGAAALKTGGAKQQGLLAAWAIEAPGRKSASVVSKIGSFDLAMKDLGDGLFVATAELPAGTALRWHIEADGASISQNKDMEAYVQDPDSIAQPGIPKGELRQMPRWKSTIFEGTERDWWIYIPAKVEGPVCVMVFQDGQWAKNYTPVVLDNLIAKKEIPPMAAVFLSPGVFADGKSNRSFEYDTLSDQYARFLLEEILPETSKVVPLKNDGESRAIAGLSSGGICAFTAAWERPAEFRRVLSWIGSFSNIAMGPSRRAGGHNYPALIRINEKKPIRVFLQDGENDLDNQFGNWWLCNLAMEKALAYKGYDHKFVGGKGFHSDAHGKSILPDTLRWLWRPL